MKLSVGYNPSDRERMISTCLKYAEQIGEIYFAWGGMASGRHPEEGDTSSCFNARLVEDVKLLTDHGVQANLLLNANCYGADSLKQSFYDGIGELVHHLREEIYLSGVTTTSPMIAAFLKREFPDISMRASINMNVRGEGAMHYLLDSFDEFYLTREYNRNLTEIQRARAFCDAHGKKLFLLANSGCQNDCPSHVFHDNLVAHEKELNLSDFRPFEATCWQYLSKEENRRNLLARSSWIRPEDLHLLDPYFDGAKLATRASPNAFRIIAAYAKGYWHGDMLALTEPSHSPLLYPKMLDNDMFPDNFFTKVLHCDKDCRNCSYCSKVFDQITKYRMEVK